MRAIVEHRSRFEELGGRRGSAPATAPAPWAQAPAPSHPKDCPSRPLLPAPLPNLITYAQNHASQQASPKPQCCSAPALALQPHTPITKLSVTTSEPCTSYKHPHWDYNGREIATRNPLVAAWQSAPLSLHVRSKVLNPNLLQQGSAL